MRQIQLQLSSLLILISIGIACGAINGTLRRTRNGDTLNAPGLDCPLHAASKIGNDTCFCGPVGSYYTDKNNVTQCFMGRGEKELGKNVCHFSSVRPIKHTALFRRCNNVVLTSKKRFINVKTTLYAYCVRVIWDSKPDVLF